ncbi:MAG: hypothetical protein HUJ31_06520, partial [Pseudomonadales bacterium]|nr:hypothetical protein [Pseudomonadales bacterium]
MRFNVTGEHLRRPLLNTIILLFLGYVVLLWLTNGLLFFRDMGLSYDAVVSYYLGDPERYTSPRSFSGMLEVAHFHVFSMGILVLTLVHLMLFANISQRAKVFWMWTPFFFAIANEGAGWLVRFVDPAFAWLKIATFLGLELSLAGLVIITLRSLIS